MDDDVRFKIAAARRILFRAGLDRDDIAGQVTARAVGEQALWTTPLELFDETMPDHVVKMPFGARATDNRVIEIAGEVRPVTTRRVGRGDLEHAPSALCHSSPRRAHCCGRVDRRDGQL